MSFILSKSDANYDSAEYLSQGGYFASSIHCAYYSCLQLMIFIYKKEKGTDPNFDSFGVNEKGFHNYLFNCVIQLIKNKNQIRTLNTYFGDLKRSRVKSDYYDNEIKPVESTEALKKSRYLRSVLKKEFNT